MPSDKNHMLVAACGILHHLPFGVLVDDSGRCLVEKYDISYAPSAATLDRLRHRNSPRARGEQIVAIGAPEFYNSIDSLPHSRHEVMMLSDVFGADAVRTYLGTEADKTRFKQQSFNGVRYLHLATHGISDERRPDRSALWLASEAPDSPPGLLLASEIAAMEIPVDLVFLSACRSGSGLRFPGEGVMSLAQPFLVAGANSVVVSHWNVDDRGAVELVAAFYEQLNRGYAKAEALAKAQRSLLNGDRELYRHPYFWAPYVLIGLGD